MDERRWTNDDGRTTNDDLDAFARHLILGGGCFGASLGWGAYAAWRGDWGSLTVILVALMIFLAYRHDRMVRSIGEEVRDV